MDLHRSQSQTITTTLFDANFLAALWGAASIAGVGAVLR